MQVSVAICTYNRRMMLKNCLESLANQEYPSENFEILIVDNNSTDATGQVIADFAMAHPILNVRYVVEMNPGISFARNRALTEAAYPIIAFIDDDELAGDDKWLQNLIEPFSNPEIHAVGGAVYLKLLADLPKWFSPELMGYLCDYKPEKKAMYILQNKDYLPITANLAVRRQSLLQIGGFNVFLGRRDTEAEITRGEDVDIMEKIFDNGMLIAIQPTAFVNHLVPESKLTKGHFLHMIDGFTKVNLISLANKKIVTKMFYIIQYLFSLILYLPGFLLQICFIYSPSERFKAQMKLGRRFFKVKQGVRYLLVYGRFKPGKVIEKNTISF